MLSRYGAENTESAQNIQKRLVHSPLFINGNNSFVAYQESQGIFARGRFLENGDFRFEEESKQIYSPLQGTFQLKFQAGSTLEFEQ